MTNIDNRVEDLFQASKHSVEGFAKENIKILLSAALKEQTAEMLDIIFKYRNQWERTKETSINGIENNEPVGRLITLLFNLIIDDIKEAENGKF